MTRMQACCLRLLSHTSSDGVSFGFYRLYGLKEHCQRKISSNIQILNSRNHFTKLGRHISLSAFKNYEIAVRTKAYNDVNLKKDAVIMFNAAVQAVCPKSMIQNMLKYNEAASQLKVENKVYHVDKNIFVVGFGKAVMGMARALEDMLGQHIVNGIISIPKGLQKEVAELQLDEMLLSQNTKIQVYEGAHNKEADETCHNAAKAIHSLITKLTDQNLLIVLCSGGGSVLCPSPRPPITLQELCDVTRLLKDNGASMRELNIVRKNIEILKGGGLALEAKPAKVLSLTLSSVIGDTADLIASGPTCPTQPAPHHCIEILKRLNVINQTPETIRRFLEKECKNLSNAEAKSDPINEKTKYDATWKHVQNTIVGNSSIACEAAAIKAAELGYLPLILSTAFTGEARNIGCLFARLAKFIMMCFDRKASFNPNTELAVLETTLVAEGIRKQWVNCICKKVDMACNSDRDICIIVGGNTAVNVNGTGTGGKNMESALAAAIQMHEEFQVKKMQVAETRMCFLSCDTEGYDGITKLAGAVIDQDFLQEVAISGLDMKKYLDNNDSFTFFNQVSGSQNLVPTKLTGTNVMDMMILLVQRPENRTIIIT